jgi:NAD(P)-dependent dehydrogenase (short-subunit alcohol dehydrogenase family)
MGSLQNKVIVITGSTRGFGLAIAHACTAEGAQVVISSRSAEAVDRAVNELRAAGRTATGMPCDVSGLAQVEALAAHAFEIFGRFDVWVNNAGFVGPYGPTAHVPPQLFMRSVQTNIVGTYQGSIVALRAFLPAGKGKLINVLGRGADGKPTAMQNAYAATKSWERSFTLAMAQEYKDSGIGIFAINPGMMTTEMLTDLTAISGYESGLDSMPTIIRMWAKPPEAPAQKIVWLASSATDGKTGLEINEMSRGILLGGALREGLRRLTRRSVPPMDVHVATVAAALPLPPRRR